MMQYKSYSRRLAEQERLSFLLEALGLLFGAGAVASLLQMYGHLFFP